MGSWSPDEELKRPSWPWTETGFPHRRLPTQLHLFLFRVILLIVSEIRELSSVGKDLIPSTCCNSCVPQERIRLTVMNHFSEPVFESVQHIKNLKKLYRRQKRQQVVCLANNSASKLKASVTGQVLTNKGIWFTGSTHTSSTCKNKHYKETFMSWAPFKKSVHTYSLVCVDWASQSVNQGPRPREPRWTTIRPITGCVCAEGGEPAIWTTLY